MRAAWRRAIHLGATTASQRSRRGCLGSTAGNGYSSGSGAVGTTDRTTALDVAGCRIHRDAAGSDAAGFHVHRDAAGSGAAGSRRHPAAMSLDYGAAGV